MREPGLTKMHLIVDTARHQILALGIDYPVVRATSQVTTYRRYALAINKHVARRNGAIIHYICVCNQGFHRAKGIGWAKLSTNSRILN